MRGAAHRSHRYLKNPRLRSAQDRTARRPSLTKAGSGLGPSSDSVAAKKRSRCFSRICTMTESAGSRASGVRGSPPARKRRKTQVAPASLLGRGRCFWMRTRAGLRHPPPKSKAGANPGTASLPAYPRSSSLRRVRKRDSACPIVGLQRAANVSVTSQDGRALVSASRQGTEAGGDPQVIRAGREPPGDVRASTGRAGACIWEGAVLHPATAFAPPRRSATACDGRRSAASFSRPRVLMCASWLRPPTQLISTGSGSLITARAAA
jgi:hypothetical protein